MSLQIGDKVRIIKYGHPIRWSKEAYHHISKSEDKPGHIIEEGNYHYLLDKSPEMVGQEGIICTILNGSYSLAGVEGKQSWYNEEQLEKL